MRKNILWPTSRGFRQEKDYLPTQAEKYCTLQETLFHYCCSTQYLITCYLGGGLSNEMKLLFFFKSAERNMDQRWLRGLSFWAFERAICQAKSKRKELIKGNQQLSVFTLLVHNSFYCKCLFRFSFSLPMDGQWRIRWGSVTTLKEIHFSTRTCNIYSGWLMRAWVM